MDVLNITKITLAWELFEAGVPKAHIGLGMKVPLERSWYRIFTGTYRRFCYLNLYFDIDVSFKNKSILRILYYWVDSYVR